MSVLFSRLLTSWSFVFFYWIFALRVMVFVAFVDSIRLHYKNILILTQNVALNIPSSSKLFRQSEYFLLLLLSNNSIYIYTYS